MLISVIKSQSTHSSNGKCVTLNESFVIKVTIAPSTDFMPLCACVRRGGGHKGSRESHTQAKGGTSPKVTHITSPELCPDTPLAFSLYLSLCLSACLFFITIKGQPEPRDREPNPKFEHIPLTAFVAGDESREGYKSTFTAQPKWGNQHYSTCGKHMEFYSKYCRTVSQHKCFLTMLWLSFLSSKSNLYLFEEENKT